MNKQFNIETGMTANAKCSRSGRRILDKIRNAGFEDVMLDHTRPRNLGRFISIAFEKGLKVPFIHLDSKEASSIWTMNDKQQGFVEYVKDSIKLCGDNGVETVVMHTNFNGTEVAPNQVGLDCIKQMLEAAESGNVKIALENNDDLPHLDYLLQNIDSPNLGFCFDSGHWNLCTPDVDLLGKYGDRLIAVHLHDNAGKQEPVERIWDQDLHLLPFDGITNFDKVARGIAKSKYNGPVMLESRRNKWGIDYTELPPEDFLKDAHVRAKKLADMITGYRTAGVEK